MISTTAGTSSIENANVESLSLRNNHESSDEEERPSFTATRKSSVVDGVLILENFKDSHLEGEERKDLSDILASPTDPTSSSESSLVDPHAESSSSSSGGEAPGSRSSCKRSLYGSPKSEEEVRTILSDGEAGLLWKGRMVPDNFDENFKETNKLKILPLRDYDAVNGCIKPRRGDPTVKASDFLSSLVCLHDNNNSGMSRWVFSGVLNGWPGLTCLELLRIEFKGQLPRWRTFWSPDKDQPPSFPVRSSYQIVSDVRLILRSPAWTAHGWSSDSLGYVFWNELSGLNYGTNLLTNITDPNSQCRNVHMISHRYAKEKESHKDKITYHSLALLEWDHQKYCSVVEIAYLNGVAGYYGRSNWYHDRDDTTGSALYRNIHPEMVTPWKDNLSEIRVHDVPVRNFEQFKTDFMERYTGPQERFLDVHYTFSHKVRLTFSSKFHIANYLINYIRR